MIKRALGIATLLVISLFAPFFYSVDGSLANVSVQPQILRIWGIDVAFAVYINVTEVTNLYGWQIDLFYDSAILNGTDINEGQFLRSAGETYFNFSINNHFNSTHGRMRAFNSLLGEIPGVNGSGTLFTAIFKTRKLGIAFLKLENVILADINSNLIPHTSTAGAVQVVKAVHDVAIKNIYVSSDTIASGRTLEIYVTASNFGNKTETFNVKAYCNETLIDEQEINDLAPQTSITLTFFLNTELIVPNATCTIRAEASQVPEETKTENNQLSYGTVKIVEGIHDVAVTEVSTASNLVYEGETLNIKVKATNIGDYAESFNVKLYGGNLFIGVQAVENLTYGTTVDLFFSWDTHGIESNQTYSLKAVADPVEGETRLENNELVDGNVTVYPHDLLSIKLIEVIPCNQFGNPVYSFQVGTMANFKLVLDCTLFSSKDILLTINVYDANGDPIGVVSFQGPVGPGTVTFILSMPIPRTSHIGNSKVYANVLSDWPHLGGIPYSPEMNTSFEIGGP